MLPAALSGMPSRRSLLPVAMLPCSWRQQCGAAVDVLLIEQRSHLPDAFKWLEGRCFTVNWSIQLCTAKFAEFAKKKRSSFTCCLGPEHVIASTFYLQCQQKASLCHYHSKQK